MIKTHHAAIAAAFLVGVIYITPHLIFQWSLGDAYRGIPMMQTANEDEYLARIQEILDGHPSLGSPVFYEYKNEPPLAPPVGEFFYAFPAMLMSISPVAVLTASRFLLPAILFILVYFLIYKMTTLSVSPPWKEGEEKSPSPSLKGGGGNILVAKITAITGGILVTLGYDLVDYRTVLGLLRGSAKVRDDRQPTAGAKRPSLREAQRSAVSMTSAVSGRTVTPSREARALARPMSERFAKDHPRPFERAS